MLIIEPGRSPPPECPTCEGIGGVRCDTVPDNELTGDEQPSSYVLCDSCGGTGRTPPEVPITCTAPEF